MKRPWLKHYPEEISARIDYPEVPLDRLLEETVKHYRDRTAIRFFGQRISYGELNGWVDRCAAAFHELGIRKGDRISISLPNLPQFVIAFYGALRVGATVIQTNPLYTERELKEILNDAGAKAIVTLRRLYPRVKVIQKETSLEHIIVTSIRDFLPTLKRWLYPLAQMRHGMRVRVPQDAAHDLMTMLAAAPATLPTVEIDPHEDVALLQYTGGTTGTPKGVMLTHYNLVVNTLQARAWFAKSREGEEVIMAALPFFHVYGMTVALNLSIYLAATMILVPRFEIDEILELINAYCPTLFPGVPTMYVAINNHPKLDRYRISSIRECISGSAPLPVEVKAKFEELTGGKLVEGYGLSEASPVTHSNLLYGEQVTGSIGIPIPDTDVKIVDLKTGEDLGVGEVGELAIRGPQVMKGYWKRPEETDAVLQNGWLYTGDIAQMDEQGYFYIVDRKKDLILASGYNVYPREVEEVLFEHPQVAEAAVVGVPDPYRGETVKAYIVLKADGTLTENELRTFCTGKLAKYKIPTEFEFRDELPKSMIGKVLKRELREEETG
ncbi:MAG: long-chain fatty acid--CoA ligase [Candidatus Bipolaricaulia bacterium]